MRDVGLVGDALLLLLAAVSAVALLLAVCDAVDVAPHETWAWKAMVSALLSAGAAWCVVGAVIRAAGRSGYRRRSGSRPSDAESGSTTVQMVERAALSLGALPACAAVLLCGEVAYQVLPLPWNVGVVLLLASVPLLLLLPGAEGRHTSRLRVCAAGVSAVLGSAVVSLFDPYPGFGVRLALDGWGAVAILFEVVRACAILGLLLMVAGHLRGASTGNARPQPSAPPAC